MDWSHFLFGKAIAHVVLPPLSVLPARHGSLNPDWTPETRSTFLLACPTKELFDLGLTLKVKDWDLIGGDDPLGTVILDGYDLMACYDEDEEEKDVGRLREYKIHPPKGQGGVDAGTLTIRYRRAFRSDFESLKNKEKKNLFD